MQAAINKQQATFCRNRMLPAPPIYAKGELELVR